MKTSGPLLLLVSLACIFLFAQAVIQRGSQDACSNYEKSFADGKPCPMNHKPVCGTDGQTYHNYCQLCKTAMERNGKLRFKHYGKC